MFWNQNPTNNQPPADPSEHPLVVAMRDMHKMAMTQRGVKALAKIKSGVENRLEWMRRRQEQIDKLEELGKELLAAFDTGDQDRFRYVLSAIDTVVGMDEKQSAEEIAIDQIIAEIEVMEGETLVQRARTTSRAAFKGRT
jgi:hypothetical protein